MADIRFRRWSDGLEMAVPTIEDYKEYYDNGLYYIPYGEHATHTPEGFRLAKPKTRRSTPARQSTDANITPEQVPDSKNDGSSGDELSGSGDDSTSDV